MTDYVELHCHSYFSLLDGASAPEDLVRHAAELGMDTLALTDHDAVYGAVTFLQSATAHGIRPVFGAEITLADGHHLTLLVHNTAGWHNLCHLISHARHNAPKGEATLPPNTLADHTAGLIALSGCRRGAISTALLRRDRSAALDTAQRLRDWFGPQNFWIELQRHFQPDDRGLTADLAALAEATGVGLVATNNVHYALRDGHRLQDVLVCIRHQTTLDASHHLRRPNSEYYLKSASEMATLFADYPQAIANTRHVAAQCDFTLDYGLQDLPVFPTPPGDDALAYLCKLCEAALPERYGADQSVARQRLAKELGVIDRGGLANYFLIVWDIVRFARSQQIRCQGRGSAANSVVAYLLGITPIDPLEHNLVFERFLSDERRIVPDIDIDFQADRREEVIQYIYTRYGHTHAAMACTYVTYRTRSAIRDTGKALGLPLSLVDQMSKAVDSQGAAEQRPPVYEGERWQQLADMVEQIKGFPRHLGIHNGGMVITGAPLAVRVPTEPATMPDRVVVQWDKQALEDVGLIKIDILGLRMLSAIAEAVDLVEASCGQRPDLDRLTFDDPAVFAMIVAADTVGVFQVESRAQAQVLPRLKPQVFADLVISISLIRPGPIQGNMVHPYLRRRLGEEPVTDLHPRLADTLGETLGVILFQEQVLKVARDLAGFTPGQGELLRRALSNKNAPEAIERLYTDFVAGALADGVSREDTEKTFDKLRAFGGYSFPKSHAAAFGVLVYQSAWLKRYHPGPFFAALLNHQPMGFWTPAVLINDARRHGVAILPVDLNASAAVCTLEDGGIRLGLSYVDKLGQAAIARLLRAREAGSFATLRDLARRTRLPRRIIENLIMIGAMDHWGIPRRQLLWDFGRLHYPVDALDLVYADDGMQLPPLSPTETLHAEYDILGLALSGHPLEFYRKQLATHGILSSQSVIETRDGEWVQVAGLVVARQSPRTAGGHVFLTLEDEDGFLNVIVRPKVYERYRRTIRRTGLLMVAGTVQRRDQVVNVIAHHIDPLG